MEKKPSDADGLFGRFAQATASTTSRRSFISKIATAGIFFLTFRKSAYAQEGGGCTANYDLDICCCCKPSTGACVSFACDGGRACCYGMVHGPFTCDGTTQNCCGDICILKTKACCIYGCTQDPLTGYWMNCTGSAPYDAGDPYATPPRAATQGCCNDGVYNLCTQGCCDGLKTFNLSTTCCCGTGNGATIACIPDPTLVPPPGC